MQNGKIMKWTELTHDWKISPTRRSVRRSLVPMVTIGTKGTTFINAVGAEAMGFPRYLEIRICRNTQSILMIPRGYDEENVKCSYSYRDGSPHLRGPFNVSMHQHLWKLGWRNVPLTAPLNRDGSGFGFSLLEATPRPEVKK